VSSFLVNAVAPLIVGPLTFVVMQGLKALSTTVDALPSVAKRVAVFVIAVALTAIGAATGVDFNCNAETGVNCLQTLDKDAVKAVVGAALAFVLHYAKQHKGKP
jgi:hypothetical protein